MTTHVNPATAYAYLMTDHDGNRTLWTRIAGVNDPPACEWHWERTSSRVAPATYRATDAPLQGSPDPAATPMHLCDLCLGDLISWVGDAHANVASVTALEECPWTDPDECMTARERSVAGTSNPIPRCEFHDRRTA